MTNDDLKAIKARCEAATPGPWKAIGGKVVDGNRQSKYTSLYSAFVSPVTVAPIGEQPLSRAGYNRDKTLDEILPNDAEFIAHSRADVPALIAEVERLGDRNEYLSKRVEIFKWAATHQHLVERIKSNNPNASSDSWRVVGCDMGIHGGDGVFWDRACEWAYNSYCKDVAKEDDE